ncbi:MAG: hypothetical protein Q8P68_05070 [Candidatus Peregrinibacteria bacterium]|nr:hypothetical protein [Candidatus Peregrinibacteria bacterium]
MKKNLHLNLNDIFNAFTEADFMERRMVFMADDGGPEVSAAAEATVEAAPAVPTADEKANTEKINKAKEFVKKLLGDGAPAVVADKLKIKADDVTVGAGENITEVKASYKGIEFTIDANTKPENAKTLNTLMSAEFDSFIFASGSKIDFKAGTATLVIDAKATTSGAAPDSLTVNVDIATNKITDITIDPNAGDKTINMWIKNLVGKPLTNLTTKKLTKLNVIHATAMETDFDALLDKVNFPEDFKGTFKNAFAEAIKNSAEGVITVTVDNTEFTMTVEGAGDEMKLSGKMPFLGGPALPFTLNDKAELESEIGDKKIVLSFEEDKVTMKGLGKNSNQTLTMPFAPSAGEDVQITLDGEPIPDDTDIVALFGEENLKSAGFTDEQIADMRGDAESEESEGDGKSGGAGKSKLDKYISRDMQNSVKGFMGTVQELIATILELLESLGIDMNKDNNADKRLWMFVIKEKLGTKNVGKLKEVSMSDFMDCYVPGENGDVGNFAATVENLQANGFDTEGENGRNLFNTLDKIHGSMNPTDEEVEAGDDAGAKRLTAKFEADGGDTDVSTFLYDSGLINRNGRWSSQWEKKPAVAPEIETPPVVEDNESQSAIIKENLHKTNVGSGNTAKIADYFISTGLSPQTDGETKKNIQVTPDKRDAFMQLLLQPIKDIEVSYNLLNEESRSLFATNIGIESKDLLTLVKWLHNPETGQYNGTTMTLTSLYGITSDKQYTLADLLSAMGVANSTEPVAVAES